MGGVEKEGGGVGEMEGEGARCQDGGVAKRKNEGVQKDSFKKEEE